MDIVDKDKRSLIMSRIRGTDTAPEKTVRSLLQRLGFRYRLHVKDLPGKPDIVLRKYTTAIFVHGCFWHQHKGCVDGSLPKSNTAFWTSKLKGNVERDQRNLALLRKSGWKVCVVWECELKDRRKLTRKLNALFSANLSTS